MKLLCHDHICAARTSKTVDIGGQGNYCIVTATNCSNWLLYSVHDVLVGDKNMTTTSTGTAIR